MFNPPRAEHCRACCEQKLQPTVPRSSRTAVVIDATLLGVSLSALIDLQAPKLVVVGLSFVSVLLIVVVLDTLFAFQKRRATCDCSHASPVRSVADRHPDPVPPGKSR